jgi:hypothetical protein
VAHRPVYGRRTTEATSDRNSDSRNHAIPQADSNGERSADATSSPKALAWSNRIFPAQLRRKLGLPEILQVPEKPTQVDPLY